MPGAEVADHNDEDGKTGEGKDAEQVLEPDQGERAQRGEEMEPEFRKPDMTRRSLKYVDQVGPDVVVIAWPCAIRSSLQNLSLRDLAVRQLLKDDLP